MLLADSETNERDLSALCLASKIGKMDGWMVGAWLDRCSRRSLGLVQSRLLGIENRFLFPFLTKESCERKKNIDKESILNRFRFPDFWGSTQRYISPCLINEASRVIRQSISSEGTDMTQKHDDTSDAGWMKRPGTNCIKIGLPGKLILSKRKGLWEVLFSRK